MLLKGVLAAAIAVVGPLCSVADESVPDSRVYRVCSKDEAVTSDCAEKPPKAISTPDPEYTDEARRNGVQESVSLSAVVGADGRVASVTVKRTPGQGLEENAVRAVRNWIFRPALKDGKAVAVQIDIEVNFRLGSFGP